MGFLDGCASRWSGGVNSHQGVITRCVFDVHEVLFNYSVVHNKF